MYVCVCVCVCVCMCVCVHTSLRLRAAFCVDFKTSLKLEFKSISYSPPFKIVLSEYFLDYTNNNKIHTFTYIYTHLLIYIYIYIYIYYRYIHA